MTLMIVFWVLFSLVLQADVISTTNQIKFDSNLDGQAEMTLNDIGLGVGTVASSKLHVNGNALVSNQLVVGGGSGISDLSIHGSFGLSYQLVSVNALLGDHSVVMVDSSSDNIVLTLPYAGNVTGRMYQIKKISTSNFVWVNGGGNLIDDTTPIELPESTELASVKLISDGNQWYKINEANVSDTVASSNLVGWWKLDETTGTLASDSSGEGFNGTLANMLGSEWEDDSGKIKGALRFDENDSEYVTMGDVLDTASGEDFTVSAWFKSSGNTGSIQRIVQKGGAGSARKFIVYINTNGVLTTQVRDDVGDTNTSFGLNYPTVNLYTGEWFHTVMQWDSSEGKMTVYLNGRSQITGNRANLVNADLSNSRAFTIGATETGAQAYDGLIDDVRFYNKILSDSEVQAIYTQGI